MRSSFKCVLMMTLSVRVCPFQEEILSLRPWRQSDYNKYKAASKGETPEEDDDDDEVEEEDEEEEEEPEHV